MNTIRSFFRGPGDRTVDDQARARIEDAVAQERLTNRLRARRPCSAIWRAGDVEVVPIMTRSDYGAPSSNRYSNCLTPCLATGQEHFGNMKLGK